MVGCNWWWAGVELQMGGWVYEWWMVGGWVGGGYPVGVLSVTGPLGQATRPKRQGELGHAATGTP